MPVVKMPDGALVRFPDEMPAEQIRGFILSRFPEVEKADPAVDPNRPAAAWQGIQDMRPDRNRSMLGAFGATAAGLINDIPILGPLAIGGVDHLTAGLQSLGGANYDETMARLQQEREQLMWDNPEAAKAGGVTGTIGSLVGAGATALGGKLLGVTGNLVPRIAAGAGSGAVISGADTLARGGSWDDAQSSALLGGIIGGAAPAVMKGASAAWTGLRAPFRAAKPSAPVAPALRDTSQASFKEVADSAAVIDAKATPLLAHDIRRWAVDEGLVMPNGTLSAALPKVRSALQAVDQYAKGPVTMAQANILRKTLQRVAKSTDPEEARLGGEMLDHLFDFMESLPASAFKSGNGAQAVNAWTRARAEWAVFRRTQMLETAQYNASLARDVPEALRTEIASILKSEKSRRGLTPDDVAAMTRFVKGGPKEAFLRWASTARGPVAGVLGHIAGGPAAGAAIMGGGAAAKTALQSGAVKAVDAIRNSVAGIPALPPVPFPRLLVDRLQAINGNPTNLPFNLPPAALPLLFGPRR